MIYYGRIKNNIYSQISTSLLVPIGCLPIQASFPVEFVNRAFSDAIL
jgi:hypothetical protein